ncbi:cyun38 [Cyclophragma undans nucleopolyhedrovirus]|uniref:Cyun38 n=1 Tax=Cyclophragma undans nucleopolyhedrovirus TaxID=1906244 RepID=A0A288Q7H2_9ABAC|nr:cyun38 [Cyclophragma undans nucleopolyhedrovirus]AOT85508.1 cyun38 [Cyclophragma undans nucleopolyhedrovirus]
MRLTLNVLLVANSGGLIKYDERHVYDTHLKNYSVIEGVMCHGGDCLVVAVLDEAQLRAIDRKNIEVLTCVDYSAENVDLLCEKIIVISASYNEYCINNQ